MGTRKRPDGNLAARGAGLAITTTQAPKYAPIENPKNVVKNWPRSNVGTTLPVQSHPRMQLARLARSRSDSTFLKTWGSRPSTT
jgi:hypothetical protein